MCPERRRVVSAARVACRLRTTRRVLTHRQLVEVILSQRDRLLAFILSIVRDPVQAEDVLQDVATLAVEKIDQLQNEQHARGWLHITARHLCWRVIKRTGKEPTTLDPQLFDVLEQRWDAVDDGAAPEMIDALRLCVSHLPEYRRQIVHHRYVHGVTGQALADALGRSLAGVRRALVRTHQALAKCVMERLAQTNLRIAQEHDR